MDIEAAKKKLIELVDDVNSLSPSNEVQFHQQDVVKKHMAIIGGNGRLCIHPTSTGYDIGLSGKALEINMYGFMRDLCQKECTGYKQTNKRIGKNDLPFWRVEDFSLVQKAAYHYAGANIEAQYNYSLPEEIQELDQYTEGSTKTISVNAYERNVEARDKCVEHHGYKCAACDFDFERTYGAIGKSYIHVHHIVPLSEIKQEYKLNPITDLVPVCPNCHAMIHRSTHVLSIDQLKELLGKRRNDA